MVPDEHRMVQNIDELQRPSRNRRRTNGNRAPARRIAALTVVAFIRIFAGLILPLTMAHPGIAQTVKHVASAQDLQNALTEAAGGSTDYVINLAATNYIGNFNFNTAGTANLTLQGDLGVTNSQIIIDGDGGSMAIKAVGNANITVKGITFARHNGTGLYVSTGVGADVSIQDCVFAPAASGGGGIGLSIVSAQNAAISGCAAVGGGLLGSGLSITGLAGNLWISRTYAVSNRASIGIWDPGFVMAGGGLFVNISGNITVSNVVFQANDANRGNAAYVIANSILLDGNALSTNGSSDSTTFFGQGTFLSATHNVFNGNYGTCLLFNGSDFILSGNSFIGNVGSAFSAGGNGLISGNTIEDNGSGLDVSSYSISSYSINPRLIIHDNQLSGNRNYPFNASSGTISFYNNTMRGNHSDYYGGGARIYANVASISNNVFSGNSTATGGGALYLNVSGQSNVMYLDNNQFIGNSSSSDGGGIFVDGGGNGFVRLSGNQIVKNAAGGTGGGVVANAASLFLIDNLVINNASSTGGGFWLSPAYQLDMVNNTIFGNSAATANSPSGSGGGAYFLVRGQTEVLHVYNNILWGNNSTGPGADVFLKGSGMRKEFLFNNVDDVAGIWDLSANNFDVDPQFFDPINGDLHLRPTSACLDSGTNGAPSFPSVDLDGNPRLTGSNVDLGCFELNTKQFHPADLNSKGVITPDDFNQYAAAWLSSEPWVSPPSPIPADYVTRAGYLLLKGGTYHNDGSAQPTNWKPGTH